jgi:hypothetical protein
MRALAAAVYTIEIVIKIPDQLERGEFSIAAESFELIPIARSVAH